MATSSEIMSATACLRVLLVEDSAVLAERISELIDAIPDIELIGVVDSESEAVGAVRRGGVDVLILDLHLRQGTGFGVMRAVAALAAKPHIVVLTNYDLPEYQSAAMGLGASFFLDKARDYSRLPQILTEICRAARNGG
ncbi:MAG TPA: response regulator [Steroidobacteraceae bacterium]|nr:response regulator [Steroidobacteraceae bacterium]